MVGGNWASLLFPKAYPWPPGVEEISGKERMLRIGRVVSGQHVRSNRILIVVGELSNLIFTQSQSADDLGDPVLQIGTTFRLFIARQREPIVNRKKVALEKGTSQWVCDRAFRMLSQKLIEQLQGFIVGRAAQ